MTSQARELCHRFDYPDELAEILEQVVDRAQAHLGDVTSIVLSPSTSTGDFLWTRGDSGVQLLSDVDGFVFVDGITHDAAGFDRALADLARNVGGPEFKLDFSLSSARTIQDLPKTYQFVETGIAGFELYGARVLENFPRTFDPRASRQAFLLNLFKPLKHRFLSPDRSGLAQAIARLILDIPTLAASERGECIAGHRARARWFLEERPGSLGKNSAIRAAVEEADAARRNPPGRLAALDPHLYPTVLQCISLLDGEGEWPTEPDAGAVKRLADWLPPRPMRRVLGEFRTVLSRPTGPISDLLWLGRRKEALAGAALVGLYQFLAAEVSGPPPDAIKQRLQEFARRRVPTGEGDSFARSICEVYLEGISEIYPSLRAPSSHSTSD